MTKRKRSIEDLLDSTCGACHKSFDTMQGLSAHQSMSKKCSWYKKGKLREVFNFANIVDSDSDLGDGMTAEAVGCVHSHALTLLLKHSHCRVSNHARMDHDPDDAEFTDEEHPPEAPPPEPDVGADDSDEDEDGELSSLYDFIEVCEAGPSNSGRRINPEPPPISPSPSPSSRRLPTLLDEGDDQCEVEEKSAGRVLTTDLSVRRKWLERVGGRRRGSNGE